MQKNIFSLAKYFLILPNKSWIDHFYINMENVSEVYVEWPNE